MAESVKSKLLRGVFWNSIEKVLLKIVQFIIGIILARLLTPSDYGLIGMLTIFVAISNVFIEGGFARALIQRQDCKDIDYSTAFVSNVGISFFIYLVLFFCAPLIASFYHEPILIDLTRVLALNFVLGAFNIVQRAKLMAAVDFKSLARINVVSTILGGVIGVSMAYCGFGVWALVGQAIGSTVVSVVMFPFFSKWSPSLRFSRESFRHLFGFGSKLMLTGVYAVIFNNISTLCIGRYYKSQQLGYYTRATQFSEMVSLTVNDVLGNVSFPVLSSLQDERERMIAVYKKSLFYTAAIIFPVMVLCALLARPMIVILLTEKWLPCVVLAQWLFLSRMFTPLSALNMNILNAVGRSDLFLIVDLVKAPLTIIWLVVTVPMGLKAMVIGDFICTFICFFINAYLPGKMFGYGALQQLKDWAFIFLSLGIMAVCVFGFTRLFDNLWIQLIGGGLIGVAAYALSCFFLGVVDSELLSLLKFRKK